LRALLLAWLQPWGLTLPVPVLLVNLLGAFLLGVVSVLADEAGLLRAETRLLLAVGVLGGFTTFSTLSWGADLLLVQGARRGAGLIYLGASLSAATAASAGILAGRALVAVLERWAVALLRRLDERGMRRRGGAHGPSARRGRRA
jgi:CrcB protein